MPKNLVIVESPAKAKTILKYLGNDFLIKASFGHVRDLAKGGLGFDTEAFDAKYEVLKDKQNVIKDLKKEVKGAETVYIATDPDREGEAIAWHLYQALGLTPEKSHRIEFNEITKTAVQNAIKSPRAINEDLVNAQQARRLLDRLVGFEISPILWKKIKAGLSAGRVQSVAVRLIVEREAEITAFESKSTYKVSAIFQTESGDEVPAVLAKNLPDLDTATAFLNECQSASSFYIESITKKESKRQASAPFTTSTLQQDAARRLGYSVNQTMTVAQRLYEQGFITYMRTDSTHLSNEAIGAAKAYIETNYGENYHQVKQFKTKSQSAQEAHEAIRPTQFDRSTVPDEQQQKLYQLIWQRTVASQMKPALFDVTTAEIQANPSPLSQSFTAKGEILRFDGFLRVYKQVQDSESEKSDSSQLPPLEEKMSLSYKDIFATQRFSRPPARFTEASLVRHLEELGIGRPSTYAPTISTIQKREYVEKRNQDGVERAYQELHLNAEGIKQNEKTEKTGQEKNKLFPTDMGQLVTQYLLTNFENIMDYKFTASIEEELDQIAQGEKAWKDMLKTFNTPFEKQVSEAIEQSSRESGERELGTDPESGETVLVRMGRYGPIAQIGVSDPDSDKKPRYASLASGQSLQSITLEEALALFQYPKILGDFESDPVDVNIGRYGPYVRHQKQFYGLKDTGYEPENITLEQAISLIKEGREAKKSRVIKDYLDQDPPLQVLNGRYGPYISQNKKNFPIPKSKDAKTLSHADCVEIMQSKGKGKK